MNKQLTIFSLPKPFIDPHISTIQSNAIKSWKRVPGYDVYILGDEPGLPEFTKENSINYIKEVRKNDHGTPYLSSAFGTTAKLAKGDHMIYMNADIIVFPELVDVVNRIEHESFLAVCRRWDVDITEKVDFNSDWKADLLKQKDEKGKMHPPTGIDLFIFNKNNWKDFPDFAVGRPGWDVWFIYEARRRKIPVIDLTNSLTILHQNHSHSNKQKDTKGRWTGPEMEENFKLVGGNFKFFTIQDANFSLEPDGLKPKNSTFLRKIMYLLLTPEVLDIRPRPLSMFFHLISPIFQALYSGISKFRKALAK